MTPRSCSAAAALLVLAGLSACATAPGVEVTRFHLNQPIARGEITVEPQPGTDAGSLEFRTYAAAVEAELAKQGFTVRPGLQGSEQVAVVDIQRGIRPGALPGRSPVTIGIGGGSFGRNVGIGLGTSFGLGKPRSTDVEMTTLAVQIKRRSDASMIWEGRAVLEDKGNRTSPDQDIARLAAALFSGFPGASGQTVTVR